MAMRDPIFGLRASLVALLYVINLLVLFLPFGLLGLSFYLIPSKAWQRYCRSWMERMSAFWTKGNYFIQKTMTRTQWDVPDLGQLTYDGWYLLIANHQSWADILILQAIFNGKIPILKFFLKRELLWTLPVASWACWLLGFPFMRRYSKKTLASHPERSNKDIEATRRACQSFLTVPTTVANFVEGTRFSPSKHQSQQSPYKYLLRPKSAGVGLSLGILGSFFHKILNVTIVYPPNKASLWHFLSGDLEKIVVRVEILPITPDWIGDYQNDRIFRADLQQKLNELWLAKDNLIEKIRQDQYADIDFCREMSAASPVS